MYGDKDQYCRCPREPQLQCFHMSPIFDEKNHEDKNINFTNMRGDYDSHVIIGLKCSKFNCELKIDESITGMIPFRTESCLNLIRTNKN